MNETEFWDTLFSGVVPSESNILVRNDISFYKLMVKLEKLGYRWLDGERPTKYDPWVDSGESGDRTLTILLEGEFRCWSGTDKVEYSIDNAPLGAPVEVEIV